MANGRLLLALLLMAMGLAFGAWADDPESAPLRPHNVWQIETASGLSLEQSLVGSSPLGGQLAACCKICRKGKACGDSCISRTKTCTKGKGCACDAQQ